MNNLLPHIPPYENPNLALELYEKLLLKPPFLSPASIDNLIACLKQCHHHSAFILQSGDCAELFEDAQPAVVQAKLDHSLKLKQLLEKSLGKKVISIDRLGGQFAKPRTHLKEVCKGNEILSYFGDLFNGRGLDEAERIVGPERLLTAYSAAKEIATYVSTYKQASAIQPHFLSHEALNLYYDKGLTRKIKDKWYNLSTHLPWLGVRSLLHSPQHIDYLATIQNPIGIKVSSEVEPAYLINILEKLNPERVEGKILLITRLGVEHVKKALPPLIRVVKQAKMPVLFLSDPMHGNTYRCRTGIKTRDVRDLLKEIEDTIQVHATEQSYLSGIHLETTHDAVTECTDEYLNIEGLQENYQAIVDPRLNPEQARRIILHVSGAIGRPVEGHLSGFDGGD